MTLVASQGWHRDSAVVGETLVAAAQRLRHAFAAGAAARDAGRLLPHAEMAQVKAARLLTARIPVSDGGPGAGWNDVARIIVALAEGDPNIAQAVQSHFAIIETLRAHAPDTLRRRVFGIVLAGGMITNAAAERGGAFYGDIATRLVETPDGLRLQGRKYYATGSLFAELLYVTGLDADGAPIAVVLAPHRQGITIEDDWNGMGQRTTASGTVRLEDVAVEPDEVVRLPGGSLRWHLQAAAQLIHVAIDTGIAKAALGDAIELARKRGRTLREANVASAVDDPYVLHTVGALSVAASGAEALLHRAAEKVEAAANAFFDGAGGDLPFVDASIAVAEAKIASTDAALEVSEKLYQVANASGTDRDLNLDRHWRNARTHTTHDPIAYKYKFIGDWLLNGRAPPTTAKI